MSPTRTTSQLTKDLRISALIFVTVVALVTILGKGGGDAPPAPPADTTAPTVSSSTPADNSTGIAHNTTVTATFSEEVDSATIDTSSFSLSDAQGAIIPAAVSLNMTTDTATLTPNQPLSKATRYTATLSTAITDVAGNALAAAVSWSFTAVDGQWGAAAKIENDDADDVEVWDIAIDAAGNGLAVWSQYFGGTDEDVLSKRFTPAGGWETNPTVLETAPNAVFDLRLAIQAASGDAIAVWTRNLDPQTFQNQIIRFNRYAGGTGWNTVAGNVSDADPNILVYAPAIAIDANGNALAVWTQEISFPTSANTWSRRYDAGTGSWEMPVIIDNNAAYARTPDIAFDQNGNALAVWQQGPNQHWSVWSNRYTAATDSWGTAVLLENDDTCNTGAPKIAVDANGNAIAIWRQSSDMMCNRSDLWANMYTASTGTWGTPEKIETDDAGSVFNYRIAFDANGNAIAIWEQDDGPDTDPNIITNIWSNRYTAGTGWGTAELVETDDAGNAWSPEIAIDANGNVLAVWQQTQGQPRQGSEFFDVIANRYTLGTGWGTPQIIGAQTGTIDTEDLAPQIAVDPQGNAIAIWGQADTMTTNLWANRLQ